MKEWNIIAIALGVVCAFTAAFGSPPSFAEVDTSLTVASNSYAKKAEAGYGATWRLGTRDQPFYLFAEYEGTTLRLLGQPMGVGNIVTGGVGAVKRWGDIEGFVEVGYSMTNFASRSLAIQDEMVYTQLLNNHENVARPAPAADPSRPHGYGGQDLKYLPKNARTSYEISDGIMGRVGVRYEVYPHVHLSASYRVLSVSESIDWWDTVQRGNGGGWWQERNTLNLNSAQFGVVFSW